jgi:dCMP deaminase
VVYQNGYRDDAGIQFLLKAGVEVEHLPVLEE